MGAVQGVKQGGVKGGVTAAMDAYKFANTMGVLPKAAGGLGKIGGAVGSAAGIASGVQQGGVSGYANAALNAGQLSNQLGATNIPGLGALGAGLNAYQGLKQGGVAGDTSAAVSLAQLGATAALGTGAAAVTGPVGMMVMSIVNALTTPGVARSGQSWKNLIMPLVNGPPPKNADPKQVAAYWNARTELQSEIERGNEKGSLPDSIVKLAAQLGITKTTKPINVTPQQRQALQQVISKAGGSHARSAYTQEGDNRNTLAGKLTAIPSTVNRM
jgi:hypothetical protein